MALICIEGRNYMSMEDACEKLNMSKEQIKILIALRSVDSVEEMDAIWIDVRSVEEILNDNNLVEPEDLE